MDIETLVARGLQILAALGGAYLVALWFVLAIWTFRDIESRSRSVVTQVVSTLLVVLFYIPGLVLYRLLRPKETLDEAYQRSLEEEYLLQDLEELPLCPSCNHFVEDDFQLCPHCNTQLRESCGNCGRLVDLRWDVCPYCGAHHHGHKEEEQEALSVGDDRWIDPAVIERRLRDEEQRRQREETRALPAATAASADGPELSVLSFDRFRVPRTEQRDEEPVAASTDADEGQAVAAVAGEPEQKTSPAQPDLSGLDDGSDDSPDETDRSTVPEQFRVRK